jgi:hypothetical protein
MEPSSSPPLITALWVAALGLFGKILYDFWNRQHERRNVAAALAGELGAYLSLIEPTPLADIYRKLAAAPFDERRRRLASLAAPPTGHPVFDKLAGKLGLLSAAHARSVSRVYNVVTGMRQLQAHLPSPRFIESGDDIQRSLLQYLAAGLEQYLPEARALVTELEAVSRQTVWSVAMMRVADARRNFVRWCA